MRVLALDTATVTGWAADDPADPTGERPIVGSFRAMSPEFAGDYGTTFLTFMRWVERKIVETECAIIIIEKPLIIARPGIFMQPATSRLLIGLTAMVELAAAEQHVTITEEGTRTIRKFFCGDGNAKKPAVMAKCNDSVNAWGVKNHNEADAAAMWAFQKSVLKSADAMKKMRAP